MASIINVFRKEESRKSPLHPRWGDVGITAPTEGSWSQFDNPHKARRERARYGPGFVPDCNDYDDDDDNDDYYLIDPPSSDKSTTKRHHLSIPKSNPLSRMRSITKRKDQKTNEGTEQNKARFSYKPIVPDYPGNLSVGSYDAQETPSVLYKPAGKEYFEEMAVLHYGLRSTGSQVTVQHMSRHLRPPTPWAFVEEEDDRWISTRSSSPASQHLQEPYREGSDKKKKNRKSFAPKPATVTMVADAEDLYG